MFDPKYRIRHRVTSINRLARYERLPPPMVDEPRDARSGDWEDRCRAVYDYMIAIKRRRGLWFYSVDGQ